MVAGEIYTKGKYFDFWVRKVVRYCFASSGEGSTASRRIGSRELSEESVLPGVKTGRLRKWSSKRLVVDPRSV